ncbi:MAG: bifunctional demethylmenaquinone methyltransferase/2-methoxy-6-polyprenyl-1,4-benzoquinol methylase UbiE [Sedimentisphaerales bacterium]|nr:bifunctional demethylmenaquinone methyltransferase/2-methoxy-6-polyprenyl-1,4-benzoquinol methylase UbiE [Sedimentisphaerales bacterium]
MNQETPNKWTRNELKNPHRLTDKSRRVRQMFDSIAGTYDCLNHLLSFNQDRSWRKRAVQLAQIQPGQDLLDLCCGTGDMALEFINNQPALKSVTGVDFSQNMLELAQKKTNNLLAHDTGDRYKNINIKWLRQDATHLNLPDNQFHCVSCVFGLRNLQDLNAGLKEIHRVLKPKGTLLVLEFALPKNPLLNWAYQTYFRLVLPVVGGIIASDRGGAYRYLPESVRSFDTSDQFCSKLQKNDFEVVHTDPLNWGTVQLYLARKKSDIA